MEEIGKGTDERKNTDFDIVTGKMVNSYGIVENKELFGFFVVTKEGVLLHQIATGIH